MKILPKVGDYREDGLICKGVFVTDKGTAVAWGNPNPDPIAHQQGIDDVNDFLNECRRTRIIRERERQLMSEREAKAQAE